MVKKLPPIVKQQLKQMGEVMTEEVKDVPRGMIRELGKQTGMMLGWGEGLEAKSGDLGKPKVEVEEKKSEEAKKLAHWRKVKQELAARPKERPPLGMQEEIEKRQALAKEEGKKKEFKEPTGRTPKGMMGAVGRRIKGAMPETHAGRKMHG